MNIRPSSTKMCHPIKLDFAKETVEETDETKKIVDEVDNVANNPPTLPSPPSLSINDSRT